MRLFASGIPRLEWDTRLKWDDTGITWGAVEWETAPKWERNGPKWERA